jgi:hypothetical protein
MLVSVVDQPPPFPLHTPLTEIAIFEAIVPSEEPSANRSTPLNKEKSDAAEKPLDKGIRMTGVQHISPWELLEDSKNTPLSLSMCGAMKEERRALRYVEEGRRLINHTHQHRIQRSFYLSTDPDEDDMEEELKEERESPVPMSAGGVPLIVLPNTPNKGHLQQLLSSVQTFADDKSKLKLASQSPQQSQPTNQQQQKQKQQQHHLLMQQIISKLVALLSQVSLQTQMMTL